jgi:hypothetical protein
VDPLGREYKACLNVLYRCPTNVPVGILSESRSAHRDSEPHRSELRRRSTCQSQSFIGNYARGDLMTPYDTIDGNFSAMTETCDGIFPHTFLR